jgi:DNA-binding NarL/FixJ family response regulator
VIRVAIVDDHPVARIGLEGVFAPVADIEVVASAETTGGLGPVVADVVLHDLYLADDQPALASINAMSRIARVLIVSAFARPEDVIAAMGAGADGYLTKHAHAELYVSAVRTLAAGGVVLSAELADAVHAHRAVATTDAAREPASGPGAETRPDQPPAVHLSPREERVLDLIAEGLTHIQVARELGITKSTVDTHVERIRVKLKARNKADLTRAALDRR